MTATITPLMKLLPRALAIVLALSAPVLAVPQMMGGGASHIIEAPVSKGKGMGFVLLVSLQRK